MSPGAPQAQHRLRIGPYVYDIATDLPLVASALDTLYGDFPRAGADQFVDFPLAMRSVRGAIPWRRQAQFFFDQHEQFGPVRAAQGYASLEWAMNWCVSVHSNEYLKLHAGVVSDHRGAVILPGVPGAGKSTLCAALVLSGWRLLSDEHALIGLESTSVTPLCRPVSLKNESIDVIRRFGGEHATLGPACADTHKGTVAHLKGDLHALSHDRDPVQAVAIVFPRYAPDTKQRLRSFPKTESFILAAYHAFNYSLLGATGFEALRGLVDAVPCFDLAYHDLDWALAAMNELPLDDRT